MSLGGFLNIPTDLHIQLRHTSQTFLQELHYLVLDYLTLKDILLFIKKKKILSFLPPHPHTYLLLLLRFLHPFPPMASLHLFPCARNKTQGLGTCQAAGQAFYCGSLCVCVYTMAYMWRAEKNMWEFIFSFHCVDSRDWTQGFRLGSKHSYLLSHTTSPLLCLAILTMLNAKSLQEKVHPGVGYLW